jgi:hypothetical protein
MEIFTVKKVDNSQKYRYERKFVIEPQFLNKLKIFFSINEFLLKKSFQSRQINNIYLDTVNFDFFNQNLTGIGSRNKVRLRWYGSLHQKVEPILEIKQKAGLVGKKIFIKTNVVNTEILFIQNFLRDFLRKIDFEENLKFDILKCHPTLINSYQRSYYESLDKMIRVTIDEKLIYYKPNYDFKKKIFSYKVKDPNIIMEIKYSNKDINFYNNFLNKIPLRLTKNSKYVNGLNAIKF